MEGIKRAIEAIQGLLHALEADAVRKMDPKRRTPLDVIVAVFALLGATALVLGYIAFGELVTPGIVHSTWASGSSSPSACAIPSGAEHWVMSTL